jgi:hypothetical protein
MRVTTVLAVLDEDGSDRTHARIDLFDVAVLFAFGVLSVWVLATLVGQSGPNRIWTGTDGPFFGDQMQFVGWIADASHHVLVSNPFDSLGTRGVFLQPGVALSGALVRLGLRPSVAYLWWKPLAVVVLFGATRSYVRCLLTKTAHRRAALVLALFYVSPMFWLFQNNNAFSLSDRVGLQAFTVEMWPGLYLWGYPFTALAVALMPLGLLAYQRDRQARRIGPWAPICGLLCAWFQPWQGATLLLIIAVSEILLWRREKQIRPMLLAVNGAAIVVPLAYYALLGRVSSAWAQSGRVNMIAYPILLLVIVVAPLTIVAIFAYRVPAVTFQQVAVRIWPIAALGEYVLIWIGRVGTFPSHALQGLGIPLAVLAVVGATHIPFSLNPIVRLCAGAALVALLVIPSLTNEINQARGIGKPSLFGASEPYHITASENAALNYLRDNPIAGAVLAPLYLGQTVPAQTGRQTWVGIGSWTPDYNSRTVQADALFSGHMPKDEALGLLKSSQVKFLLSDCAENYPLAKLLGTAVSSERRFGCATVYMVSGAASPSQPRPSTLR